MFASNNLESDAAKNGSNRVKMIPAHIPNMKHALNLGRMGLVWALVGGIAALLCACGGGGAKSGAGPGDASETQNRARLSEEARAVFGRDGSGGERQGGTSGGARPNEGWTIVLAAFAGEGHQQSAEATLGRIRQTTGLHEARVQARGRGTAVVYGEYASPTDARARRDLERVRGTTVDNAAVFAGAFLAPPRTSGATPGGRHALSNARSEFGRGVRYTLQIAVYESPRREEAMRAAEQAAEQLRRDGEPAYFHHGPTRSMVTVGAFTAAEARPFLDRAPGQPSGGGSPLLWELHRRHPQNLFNGNQPLMESGADGRRRAQASFLVEIP